MNNEQRIVAMLNAAPDTLALIDDALTGRTSAPERPLRLFTFTDAARALRVSRCTLWRAVRDGKLHAIEIRPGTRRIPEAALRLFAGVDL